MKDRSDERIQTIGVAVRATLARIFGESTDAYNRYFSASVLDTAGIAFGYETPCTRSLKD